MPQPGWYPDPDGTPGRYRWWTGTAWTDRTTDRPTAPPTDRPETPAAQSGSAPFTSAPSTSAPSTLTPSTSTTERRRAGRVAVLLGALALVVAVALVIAVVGFVRSRSASVREDDPNTVPQSSASGWDDSSPLPTASASASPSSAAPPPEPVPSSRPEACDQYTDDSAPDLPGDGRVHGGPLSYRELGGAWSEPAATGRVPYSKDSWYQYQMLPEEQPWAASVYVGLTTIPASRDGRAATTAMLQCVVTSDFYTGVDLKITENAARSIKISGTPAVQRDVLLRFHDARLKTTGSRLRFIVVDSHPRTYYFAAVPMERDDLIKELDDATASLRLN